MELREAYHLLLREKRVDRRRVVQLRTVVIEHDHVL